MNYEPYEWMEPLDDLTNYTATEIGRATGLNRKVVSQRGKRLGVGTEKTLSLNENTSGRTYYSVDDALVILGEGNNKSLRNEIRRCLVEGTKSKLIQTISENKRPVVKSKPIDLQQLRKSLGDIAYKSTLRSKGFLTLNEVKNIGVNDTLFQELRNEGLGKQTDGIDILISISDLIGQLASLMNKMETLGYEDELKTTLPVVDESYTKDIVRVSQFLSDSNYRERLTEVVRTQIRKERNRI